MALMSAKIFSREALMLVDRETRKLFGSIAAGIKMNATPIINAMPTTIKTLLITAPFGDLPRVLVAINFSYRAKSERPEVRAATSAWCRRVVLSLEPGEYLGVDMLGVFIANAMRDDDVPFARSFEPTRRRLPLQA